MYFRAVKSTNGEKVQNASHSIDRSMIQDQKLPDDKAATFVEQFLSAWYTIVSAWDTIASLCQRIE